MGRKKTKAEKGYCVLGRLKGGLYWDGFCWDGKGWTDDLRKAVQYEWCGRRDGSAEQDKRQAWATCRNCNFLYVPPAALDLGGDESEIKKLVRLAGDFNVLCRIGVAEFWDGVKWVDNYLEAEQYLCAPSDDFDRAERDRVRLEAAGIRSGILFIPSPTKLKRRNRP